MQEQLKSEVQAMSDPILRYTPYYNGEFEVMAEKDSNGSTKLIVYICRGGGQGEISSQVSTWLGTLSGVNPNNYYMEFDSNPDYSITCK